MRRYSIILFFLPFLFFACKNAKQSNIQQMVSGWDFAKKIEERIVVPSFPNRSFNILDYGAKESVEVNNTEAFQKAIKACSDAGGGKVIVPKGVFYTGAIHLLDNVNLHLLEGAEIRFSTNPNDYLPVVLTSFEGTECMNYSPLIYAFQKKNIAITGKGILNGQADISNWWPWCSKDEYGWKAGMPSQKDKGNRERLITSAAENIAPENRIFGSGFYLRPSFIETNRCENILIQGVKIINAPFWVIHPFLSTSITVDGVTVESHGPNNDGCDPEYSKNVMIKNCTFNTGDDCIAIKSGRDADGRRIAVKSENIIVRNCNMIDGHGGVVMGSETSGGVSNVFVENCTMDSPNLDRVIRIKTNSNRGGLTENVYVRNIKVGQVKECVLKLNMFYVAWDDPIGTFIPEIRNIYLENIQVENGGSFGILAKGFEQSPIQNVTLKNVTINKVGQPYSIENVKNLKLIDTYMNGILIESPN
jgi:polygalacturonase